MSDGPHRTLPMRNGWKRLAKRADKSAFNPQDVAEGVGPALAGDWTLEISREFLEGLHELCGGRQGSLFGAENDADFEALKRLAAGRGSLGGVLVDFAAQAMADGKSGEAALLEAAENALHDRAMRDMRSVEEHYLRESSARRAANVRSRMEKGVAAAGIGELAGKLLTQPASSHSMPAKHDGIDDGVDLR
jgi:hypothetical protein